ncbi:MAG: flagellar basal-body rod protein FlgG [Planctomycetes bacterium]|nr:flagellar basal-body rod protein FlgG [Planctomycetota bacterium]
MIKALYTAATGMKAQQLSVDVIANNLANVNTSGFKKSQIDFQDLLYVSYQRPGLDVAQGFQAPTGLQVGSGSKAVATTKIFTPGTLQGTGRNLDVAIQGDGFFQVTLPDGTNAYTRAGSLQVDRDLNLVTSDGKRLVPAITLPSDTTDVTIGADGGVAVRTAGAPNSQTQVGQITLVRFVNPAGLSSRGANLFEESPASGSPQTVTPGTQCAGELQQGFLEGSNVDVVTELVGLITAQRAYEINSRAIRTTDEMLSTLNALNR